MQRPALVTRAEDLPYACAPCFLWNSAAEPSLTFTLPTVQEPRAHGAGVQARLGTITGRNMVRTIFSVLGVLFAALVVFCTTFVGRVAIELQTQGDAYEKLAVDITRDLSRQWSVSDIRQHYASPVARKLGGPAAQAKFVAMRPLGTLRYVDNMSHRTRWDSATWGEIVSPAAAAELLAGVLTKSVKVTFVAKFATGFANVSVELRSEGGRMKLWNLDIDGHEELLRRLQTRPQAISRA
jgi:hypothetical protein